MADSQYKYYPLAYCTPTTPGALYDTTVQGVVVAQENDLHYVVLGHSFVAPRTKLDDANVYHETSVPVIYGTPIIEGVTEIIVLVEEAAGCTVGLTINSDPEVYEILSASGAATFTVAALTAGDTLKARAQATDYRSTLSDYCETVTVEDHSDAPVITPPIANGATTVEGTSTEADDTVIEVFVNDVSIDTTTVTGNAWTLTVAALTTGDVVTATATATGEATSPASTPVTVKLVSAAPVVTSPIADGATSIPGTSTEADTTVIEVFIDDVSVGTTTVTSNAWAKTVSAVSTGDSVTATATAPSKIVSVASTPVVVTP